MKTETSQNALALTQSGGSGVAGLMAARLTANAASGKAPGPGFTLPANDNEWALVQQAADRHGFTGTLGALLPYLPWKDRIPGLVMVHCRRVYLQQWQRSGLLCREIERISSHLSEAGLPHLFYKGPLLALRVYGHPGSRAVHDIDVLVPEQERLSAYDECFISLGYQRRSRVVFPWRLTRAWLNQLEYQGQRFALEPHWSLQRHASLKLDTDRIWQEASTQRTPAGIAVSTLSDEYTLLAIVLSIPADLQNGSLRLRTLLDLHLLFRLLEEQGDWAGFWQRRQAEHSLRLVAATLAVVTELFGPIIPLEAAVPEDAVNPALVSELTQAVLGTPATSWQRKRLAWRLFESSFFRSAAWWTLTLPARVLAHPGVSLARLRGNLQ